MTHQINHPKINFLDKLIENQPIWVTVFVSLVSALIGSFWYLAEQNKEIALLQSSYADISSDHQSLTEQINKLNDKIDHVDDKIDSVYVILLGDDKQRVTK
jgi:peptidoglycan hydrolase CwlO-like protein